MYITNSAFNQGIVQDINFTDTSITDTATGTPYDTFHIQFAGSLKIDVGADGWYDVGRPQAAGGILQTDHQTVFYAASWPGDTNLNGSVTSLDLDQFTHSPFFNDAL